MLESSVDIVVSFDSASSSAEARPLAQRFSSVTTVPFGSGPNQAEELTYINGLNSDGSISSASYWGDRAITAFKFGQTIAGTGATVSYAFDSASSFTPQEQQAFLMGLAMWSSVANVTFVAASTPGSADILLQRASDGDAHTDGASTLGSGTRLGGVAGQTVISIDTSVFGFDLSGSFNVAGGYGLSTLIHELGHALGLGHSGNYDGSVNPATEQFSQYDERMYTVMSYIAWDDSDARYRGDYSVVGTYWGEFRDDFGNGTFRTGTRSAPHTVMGLDILAIQQLYGAPLSGPLMGGQTYGFNSNIVGPLHNFFDFTINTHPVVTLFNTGVGNSLDLSGFSNNQVVNISPGTFSNVGGLFNNIYIADSAHIDTVIGGTGDDIINGNNNANQLFGNNGDDIIHGMGGDDWIIGGSGSNILFGDGGNDRIEGAGGTTGAGMFGGDGADILIGGIFNDTLDGGAGDDLLSGGAGNDSYFVDSTGDLVFENDGEGAADSITSSISFYLYAGIEILRLGANASFGVGNALDNQIFASLSGALLIGGDGNDELFGNSGVDSLFGQDGADRLYGNGGVDYLVGGSGNDLLLGGNNADALYGGDGDDVLYADTNDPYAGATIYVPDFVTDILVGGEGNDELRGASGLGDYDLMDGGGGNDTYYVDTPADLTFEGAAGGTDTVYAKINGAGYYLYANVENLVLEGFTPFGVGNELNNVMIGNASGNYLLGGAGDDVLNGKAGSDVLFGEAGADIFVFERGSGGDVIGDFIAGVDKIDLSATSILNFQALLNSMHEVSGTTAIDLGAGDFVVINGVAIASFHAGDFIFASGGVSAGITEVINSAIDMITPDLEPYTADTAPFIAAVDGILPHVRSDYLMHEGLVWA